MMHTYMFSAPTTFLNLDTNELEIRHFGLKMEDIEDEDSESYFQKAKEAIDRKVKEECEKGNFKAAYHLTVTTDGSMKTIGKYYL